MLKTFINGNSVNLTPVGKPPVTFVNGAKKSLVKGVTFINGEKVILWDSKKLQINYIDLTSVSGADSTWPVAFFANKNRVLYSNYSYVNRLDTSNLGEVTLETRVNMGDVFGFSSVDSTDGTAVFYACNKPTGSVIFNQLNVDNTTGAVLVTNAQSYSGGWNVGAVGYVGNWLNANVINNSNRQVYVRNGATTVASYQVLPTSGSFSGSYSGCPNFTKINSSTLVGRYQRLVGGTTDVQLGEFTTSGVVGKIVDAGREFLFDNDIVATGGGSGLSLYSRDINGDYTVVIENTGIANHSERLIGKCRNKYYTVCEPTVNGGTGDDAKYFLRVFDDSGVLEETIELDGLSAGLSPNSYSRSNYLIPQLSKTGYLVFGNATNKKLVVIQCY